jgi:hypothetical protein
MNNINTIFTWIRSWLPEKSQKQAQIEFNFAKVQAVESTDRPTLPPKLFPHSLSHYFYLQRLDPNLED